MHSVVAPSSSSLGSDRSPRRTPTTLRLTAATPDGHTTSDDHHATLDYTTPRPMTTSPCRTAATPRPTTATTKHRPPRPGRSHPCLATKGRLAGRPPHVHTTQRPTTTTPCMTTTTRALVGRATPPDDRPTDQPRDLLDGHHATPGAVSHKDIVDAQR